jgi:hypothetical protein
VVAAGVPCESEEHFMPYGNVTSNNLQPIEINNWSNKDSLRLDFFFDGIDMTITDASGYPSILLDSPEKLDDDSYLTSLKASRIYYDAFKTVSNGWLTVNDDEEDLDYIEFFAIGGILAALKQELIIIPDNIRVLFESAIHKRVQRLSPQPGYIYLVQAIMPQTLFKIGYSAQPVKRIESLGVKLPFPIAPLHLIPTNDTRTAERELHDKYASKRVNGEWFNLTPDDVIAIRGLDYIQLEV